MNLRKSLTTALVLAALLLTGCEITVRDEVKEKFSGVTEKAVQIKEDFAETKAEVEAKIDEVERAVDAVNDVFEGSS